MDPLSTKPVMEWDFRLLTHLPLNSDSLGEQLTPSGIVLSGPKAALHLPLALPIGAYLKSKSILVCLRFLNSRESISFGLASSDGMRSEKLAIDSNLEGAPRGMWVLHRSSHPPIVRFGSSAPIEHEINVDIHLALVVDASRPPTANFTCYRGTEQYGLPARLGGLAVFQADDGIIFSIQHSGSGPVVYSYVKVFDCALSEEQLREIGGLVSGPPTALQSAASPATGPRPTVIAAASEEQHSGSLFAFTYQDSRPFFTILETVALIGFAAYLDSLPLDGCLSDIRHGAIEVIKSRLAQLPGVYRVEIINGQRGSVVLGGEVETSQPEDFAKLAPAIFAEALGTPQDDGTLTMTPLLNLSQASALAGSASSFDVDAVSSKTSARDAGLRSLSQLDISPAHLARTSEADDRWRTSRWEYVVFISHAGEDKAFAHRLHHEFNRIGLSAFLDQASDGLVPGDKADPLMLKAVKEAPVGLALLSEHFPRKEWHIRELRIIVEQGTLLPILYNITYDEAEKLLRTSPHPRWVSRTETWTSFTESMLRISAVKNTSSSSDDGPFVQDIVFSAVRICVAVAQKVAHISSSSVWAYKFVRQVEKAARKMSEEFRLLRVEQLDTAEGWAKEMKMLADFSFA